MAFVKLVKNKAYFMRFQTKFKRRIEGKTDYFARKRLVVQDKDKYNTPKYRLVARITATRVTAQVIYSTIKGDKVFCSADSTEFKKWGLTTGLANYASAYATGLLVARRLLKKVGLDSTYQGNKKYGADYDASAEDKEKRPFKVILDVGLRATTTGSKVFAVMKGASDGGLYVPHSDNRFPKDKKPKGKGKATEQEPSQQSKALRNRVLGAHVDEYMKKVKGSDKGNLQFSKWNEVLKTSGAASVEKLFEKIHAQIRSTPQYTKKAAKQNPTRDQKKYKQSRLNAVQRRANAKKRIEIRLKELKRAQKK